MAASPFTAPSASLDVATPLKESDYVKAFFAYFVCALIAGLLGGASIGGVIGAAWGASGAATSSPAFRVIVIAASVMVALLLHYAIFRFFVKRYIVRKLSPVNDGAA